MSRIAVVGGGLGGLCAGIRLSALGHRVDIFEKNPTSGGKLWSIEDKGYRFSYGPSTLMMPELYVELMETAGIPRSRLQYSKLEINHRDIYCDGTFIDASSNDERMISQLSTRSAQDAAHWKEYKITVEKLARLSKQDFFQRGFSRVSEYLSPRLISSFLQVRPFQTMHQFHRSFFTDSGVVESLDRYATFVGSDPRRVPATLAMIGGLEYGDGVYRLIGGAPDLVTALTEAANKTGVKIHLLSPVQSILVDQQRVVGVQVHDEVLPYDRVVYNGDRWLISDLLRERAYAKHEQANKGGDPLRAFSPRELSLSGFVLLLGVRRQFAHLHHHTVFFPTNYYREFDDIFQRNSSPQDPTIYVCNTSWSDSKDAPMGASNLFVLVNVPARFASDEEWQAYQDHVLTVMETRCGLTGLKSSLEVVHSVTPNQLAKRTRALNGAIYGSASHGLAAFRRPGIQSPAVKGLYFVGGTNHPGGGTPMVAIGAKLVANAIGPSTLA